MSFYVSVPGPMPNETATELAMVYLFLSVERPITAAELTFFEKTGENIKGFSEAKGAIIGECEKLLNVEDTGKGVAVSISLKGSNEKLNKLIMDYFQLTPKTKTNCNACGQLHCLGFSSAVAMGIIKIDKCPYIKVKDGKPVSRFEAVSNTLKECVKDFKRSRKYQTLWWFINLTTSEGHRRLTELWVEEGGINPTVLAEMRDTTQTFQSLEQRRKLRAFQDDADIDKNWQDTVDSIETLIAIG